jgi:hypothetical protein
MYTLAFPGIPINQDSRSPDRAVNFELGLEPELEIGRESKIES